MFFQEHSFRAAVYLRLSRDDGDKLESDSIRNQRILITEFINQQTNITLEKEYVDDGFSGTNFDRPAFKRMVEDAKKRRINCIIVKDLSRLGRNYIETGRYLEKIFPMLGIRFIAINDHYDSAEEKDDAGQIIVPFKNLINDAYCRDISIKIRSQLDVKRKRGQFIGSFAGYGYCKDPENKNHLIIDKYAAGIVQLIFRLKMDGYSSERIADHLNELGVLTPMEYKRQCGLNYNTGFRCSENPHWVAQTVTRILKNEIYTGTMVQGKNQKINYKVKKSRKMKQEDWIRVEGTHDAIIPQEVFECVQTLLLLDTRTSPDKESVYLLSGILRCGDCGQNMVRRSVSKNGKKYFYYYCSTYKKKEGCYSHIISEGKIKAIILKAIQDRIALAAYMDKFLEKVKHLPEDNINIQMLDQQIDELTAEIERYKDMKVKLYQDMRDGVVNREEYEEFNQSFLGKIQKAEKSRRQMEEKREDMLGNHENPREWIREFLQFGQVTKLERKILVVLIEKILVYGKDHVEICFKYEDEMQALLHISGYSNKKEVEAL